MMKNKRNDFILNSAFERQELKEILTKEEETELSQLSKIKDALSTLKNVPECQLSNERLRNAILDKGVRRTSTIGWTTLGAVAACAFISVIILNSERVQSPVTQVAISDKAAPAIEDIMPKLDESQSNVAPAPVTTVQEQPVKNAFHKRSPLKDRGTSTSKPMPANRDAELLNVSLPAESTKVDEAVVVVDSQYVAETGAYEAVELEAFGDVVFGG